MKKLLLFIIFILFTANHSYTQVYGQSAEIVTGLNALQNYPNPFKELTTINFNLKEDCRVKLYVVNLQTEEQALLVDGEMTAGEHGVIFKAYKTLNGRSAGSSDYKCVMEVHSLTGDVLMFTEIKMTQK